MAKVINCACGETIRGETEDEVLDNAEQHVQDVHADMADPEQHVQDVHADMADQFPRETLAGMVQDE